jgi:hypothetical protein
MAHGLDVDAAREVLRVAKIELAAIPCATQSPNLNDPSGIAR